MTEQELIEEYKIVKDVEDEIDNLNTKRNILVGEFLKKLPFQSGDMVKNKCGTKFIIGNLEDASFRYDRLNVSYTAFKIKKDGKPYATPCKDWSVGNYFSLEKVNDNIK